jgi:hypothetical protein
MRHKHHFDTSKVVQRETVKISKMIDDLNRTVQLLDCYIAADEGRAGTSDRSDAAYPVLARTIAARRDNLMATVTALKQRLAKLDRAQLAAEPA